MREGILRTLLLRGISLKVRNVEPELRAELAAWRRDFRAARVARAHEAGRYDHGGRKRSIDREPIQKLLAKGLTPIEVSRRLNIPSSSVYPVRDALRRDGEESA